MGWPITNLGQSYLRLCEVYYGILVFHGVNSCRPHWSCKYYSITEGLKGVGAGLGDGCGIGGFGTGGMGLGSRFGVWSVECGYFGWYRWSLPPGLRCPKCCKILGPWGRSLATFGGFLGGVGGVLDPTQCVKGGGGSEKCFFLRQPKVCFGQLGQVIGCSTLGSTFE